MTDLWYPEARRWSGNPAVTGYPDAYAASVGYPNGQRGPKRGEVKHSAEGESWDVIHDLLITKSWHFTVGYDRVEQHHEIDINCWHGADTDNDQGVRANFDLIGVEHLGVAGEPLTAWQTVATIKLSRWLGAQYGRSVFQRFGSDNTEKAAVWLLCEHKEVANAYTACPSDRIPWGPIMAALNKEDEMTPAQMAELKAYIHSELQDVLRLTSVDVKLDHEAKAALARIEAELAKVPKS